MMISFEERIKSSSLTLPASHYSKIFWIEALRLAPEEQHYYHLYGIFHYSEAQDVARLEAALQMLVNNSYNLRTTFAMQNEVLHQIIKDTQEATLFCYEIDCEEKFQEILVKAISEPFNLIQGPLFRFILITHLHTKKITFLPIFHHIIIDGTQFDSLMQRISDYYHCPIKLQVTDKAEIQSLKEYLVEESEQVKKGEVQYWLDKLSSCPLDINFPKIDSYTESRKAQKVYQLHSLNGELYTRLKLFSHENGISLFQILKAVWAILLSQYSNQKKLAISFPINMREKKYSMLKGAFLNIPLYLFERVGTFREYVNAEKEEGCSRKHWQVSRLDLISALSEQFNAHDFSVSFSASQLFLYGPTLNTEPEYEKRYYSIGVGNSKLCFFYQDLKTELMYCLTGLSEWVNEAFLTQIQQHIEILLTKVLDNPDVELQTLSCLSKEEDNKLAYVWNAASVASYQQHKTIHQLFEEQAEKTPYRIAIVSDEISLTYKTLNEQANQLAHYLKDYYALKPDDLVAVGLESSVQTIIFFLGILKADAAYVPINPHNAVERLRYMLEDAQPKLVIIQDIFHDKFSSLVNKKNILLWNSSEVQQQLHQQPLTCTKGVATDRNLGYVMYTSGTTGIPKGVMVEHHNVVSLTKEPSCIQIPTELVTILLADITFDAATFEIYSALLNGGTLCIPKNSLDLLTSPSAFKEYLIKNNINVLFLTKALFDQIYLFLKDAFQHVEYLLVGGEALNYSLMADLLASEYKPRYLLNVYGPTECTTFSTVFTITKDNIAFLQSIPIGKGVSGRTMYILDDFLNLLPIGAIGELYISGTGLARGYLNSPELTAEKFITNPFEKNTRLYKTGDLVRYLPSGNIEFIGRNDFQVKINGYRIELSDVEYHLCQYPGIKQAVVLFQTHYLVAYYVANNLLDEQLILETLSKQLPYYMLPKRLIFLERIPLTPNGKLDRHALSLLEINCIDDYIAPRTPIEQIICDIYADIFTLPIEKISIKTDFYRLGGNSLLAIQLIHNINEVLKIHLSLAIFLAAKTPEELALAIGEMGQESSAAMALTTNNLTSAERWLLEQEAVINANPFDMKNGKFLIPLREEGDKLPLFVIPGGWGEKNEMLAYKLMSLHFDLGRPIYGIRSRVSDPQWQIPETLREQAQAVFTEMKTVQPNGPYYILGECIAGNLVIELATLLKRDDEVSGIIILIDTKPSTMMIPANIPAFNVSLPESVKNYYNLLLSCQHVLCQEDLHFILSSDIENSEGIFNYWKSFSKKQFYFYHLKATHASYSRQEVAETVTVINEILKDKN